MNYNEILEQYQYKVCKDNIIRDKKNHPKCCNEIFQHILEKIQDNKTLSIEEDNLYGCCILSLAEVILNNKMMKFQSPEIKEAARGEMYEAIIVGGPKYFDRTKGSTAYSYCFRVGYTACVHVLEKMNAEKEFINNLKELVEEELALMNSARKVCTSEI